MNYAGTHGCRQLKMMLPIRVNQNGFVLQTMVPVRSALGVVIGVKGGSKPRTHLNQKCEVR